MRLFLLLMIFIPLPFTGIAQKELSTFGKVGMEDLQLKDCSFDSGANAFKLIDWGTMYFVRKADEFSSFTTIYERRTRIKILKASGLFHANLVIPFYSNHNDEKITHLAGFTYNIEEGGKIKKTAIYKNTAYTRRISKQYSELILVFPEVKVGSIIEYKYSIEAKTAADIKDWNFQGSIPTRYSEYEVKIPSFFRFAIEPLTADSLEMKETTSSDHFFVKSFMGTTSSVQKNFIMRNLPSIHSEPMMGAAKDYIQRLSFRLSGIDYGNGNVVTLGTSWQSLVKELWNDPLFGRQLKRRIPATAGLLQQADSLQTVMQRAIFMRDYIKNYIRWSGKESIYAEDGIKITFQRKTGSSGDINLLLLFLLNQAGIPAKPVLFSTRNNGLVNTKLPFADQFNTVLVLLESEGNRYFLDATDRFTPAGLVPLKILNTKGLVAVPGDERWVTATDTLHSYRVITAVRGEVDSNGVMRGDAFITSTGYARTQHYKEWDNGSRAMDDPTNQAYAGLLTDHSEVTNLDNDSLPLEEKMDFSARLNKSGEYHYFKMNLFSELQTNKFLSTERRTDIDFGYRQAYTLYGSYTIPADYVFEELPQNISLIMPDTSIEFRRFVEADNNSLNVRITVDFKRHWYAAGEYPQFAAFNKLMLSKLNEQIIIKKKDQL